MQIHEFLDPGAVSVGLTADNKEDLIVRMIDLLAANEAVKDVSRIKEAVLERESTMSTGVGKGLALPHAKTDAVRQTVASIATLTEPIEYGSIDDEPVRIVFLLVGTPDAKSQHVKILSRISRLMNRDSFREHLLECTSPEELLTAFRESESNLLDV